MPRLNFLLRNPSFFEGTKETNIPISLCIVPYRENRTNKGALFECRKQRAHEWRPATRDLHTMRAWAHIPSHTCFICSFIFIFYVHYFGTGSTLKSGTLFVNVM